MKKVILITCLSFCYLISFTQETGTFKDTRDGKMYKTVKIGTQWIMAENLAYKPSSGNCWVYDNNQNNITKYGYLYDWETAKKVAPQGWHLPSLENIKVLFNFLGGEQVKVLDSLRSNSHYNFNIQYGGYRYKDGTFKYIDSWGGFWSSSAEGENPWAFYINDYGAYWAADSRVVGRSVRLFKDN
jgi:uncharacterized protein (TIGR02145 family)